MYLLDRIRDYTKGYIGRLQYLHLSANLNIMSNEMDFKYSEELNQVYDPLLYQKRISFHHKQTLTKHFNIKYTFVRRSRSVDRYKSFLLVFFHFLSCKKRFRPDLSSLQTFICIMTDTFSSQKVH